MLKLDIMLIFFLSLFAEADLSKIISCILGFFAGMCLFLAGELRNKTLTLRSFLIRLLSAIGVVFVGVIGQDSFFPTWNTAIVVAACTFFSETIITIGTVGFIKYIKRIAGVQDEPKNDINV